MKALPLQRRPERPLWMGILNATPDSFSDGGCHHLPAAARARADRLQAAGADWLDLGAESTRPGFTPLAPAEEWARMEPVLRALNTGDRLPLSIDTRHAEVARAAFRAGADLLNDVGGLADPAMLDFARRGDFPVIWMHGMAHVLPPEEHRPAHAIADWFRRHLTALDIHPDRLLLDPGIGFGTTREQDAAILRDPSPLLDLGLPLLIGLSRKRVLRLLSPGIDPDTATFAWSWTLWQHGAAIARIHALPPNHPPSPFPPPPP